MTPLERAAIDEMRAEVLRALRIEEILTWLAHHLPTWTDRLPTLPRWMGLMFWIYAVVAMKAALLLFAVVSGQLRW